MRIRGVLILLLYTKIAAAQFTYSVDQSIPVTDKDGQSLLNPWAGGLNAAQFSTIHLNEDGKEDLVLFDRTSNHVLTFVNQNNQWKYAPQYEALFPEEITNWMLLKDFDCDGKKDIFCGDIMGVKAYRNVAPAPGPPQFERVTFTSQGGGLIDILLTTGFSGKINIQMQYDDLPTILDIDGDGDLDLLNVRFTGNGSVEFHKNVSIEKTGKCGLDLERQTQMWGGITQCKCSKFAYDNNSCATSSGRVQHAGGKALLAIDLDGDNDHELLFSEAECRNIYALINNGDNANPVMQSNFIYPSTNPVDLTIFPAVFNEDVDFDGLKDLIASPNIYKKDLPDQDLKASTWFYKNVGIGSVPDFMFVKNNFFQDQMIDVGDNSVPAFTDLDGDGDFDMLVANNSDASSFGSISLYRNIGDIENPAFQFETDDFISFKTLELSNIKVQFTDLNADGKEDLAFMAADNNGMANLYYLPAPYNITNVIKIDFPVTTLDNFHFTDVDRDGRKDLLFGKYNGALEFWRNELSATAPSFTLRDRAFLGITSSTSILNMSISSFDLDSDGNDDLILTDQSGNMTIVNNYRFNTFSNGITNIVFNSLVQSYVQPRYGKSWATAAPLFKSARPAIVMGNIRGGLIVLRNEDLNLQFEDLILNVYPNPVGNDEVLGVESNIELTLDVFNTIGQKVMGGVPIRHGASTIDKSKLATGLYILHFHNATKSVSRKLVVK